MSRVDNELSEIFLINEILEMSLEGPKLDSRMTHPVMEGAIIPESESHRILRKRSSWVLDPRLIFDGVEHMIDKNPEWNYFELYNAVFV